MKAITTNAEKEDRFSCLLLPNGLKIWKGYEKICVKIKVSLEAEHL